MKRVLVVNPKNRATVDEARGMRFILEDSSF